MFRIVLLLSMSLVWEVFISIFSIFSFIFFYSTFVHLKSLLVSNVDLLIRKWIRYICIIVTIVHISALVRTGLSRIFILSPLTKLLLSLQLKPKYANDNQKELAQIAFRNTTKLITVQVIPYIIDNSAFDTHIT